MSIQALLPITPRTLGQAQVQAVNARDLHAFLEVATAFRDWIARRIEDFGFLEGTDFCSFLSESQGGRPAKEYALTLGMAKELAMVERNEKGKQARLYFIECERRAQDPVQALLTMTRTQMLELALGLSQERDALREQAKAQQSTIATLEPKAAFCDQVSNAKDAHTLNEAGKILGTGQNRLAAWLVEKGYFYRAAGALLPYQQFLDQGLFRLVERCYQTKHEQDRLYAKILITGKGMVALQQRMSADRPGALMTSQRPLERGA